MDYTMGMTMERNDKRWHKLNLRQAAASGHTHESWARTGKPMTAPEYRVEKMHRGGGRVPAEGIRRSKAEGQRTAQRKGGMIRKLLG